MELEKKRHMPNNGTVTITLSYTFNLDEFIIDTLPEDVTIARLAIGVITTLMTTPSTWIVALFIPLREATGLTPISSRASSSIWTNSSTAVRTVTIAYLFPWA